MEHFADIPGATRLQELCIDGGPFGDCNALCRLPLLRVLRLTSRPSPCLQYCAVAIASLTGLSQLGSLRELELHGGQRNDVAELPVSSLYTRLLLEPGL